MADNNTLSSREAIETLHARGWTDTSIGRLLGRDSSLVHQVAVGKKPGSNLAGSLNNLVNSGIAGPKSSRLLPDVRVLEAPRRVRASGEPARVRLGRVEREALRGGPTGGPVGGARRLTGGAGGPTGGETRPPRPEHVRELPNGQRQITGSSKASANFVAGLAGDMGGHTRINVAYKDANGKWHMPARKGGMSPEQLRAFTRGRTWREALAAMAEYYYGAATEAAPTGEAEFYIVGA